MKKFPLVIGVFWVVLLRPFVVSSQNSPSNIEIIIEGKRYLSIHEYQREKIREDLSQLLSTKNLSEFSDEEILSIIQEVRNSKNRGDLPSQSSTLENPQKPMSLEDKPLGEDNAPDLDGSQMMEMLDKYQVGHKGAVPFVLKPDKMKNIIIQPKSSADSQSK